MGERVGRVWEKEGVYRQELPAEREQRFRKKFGKFSNTAQSMRDVISKLAKKRKVELYSGFKRFSILYK